MSANTPQPPPVMNNKPHIADLVVADIHERKVQGIAKYGTPLQPHNGRDALVDAYQEVLDLAQYIRQEIEERKARDEKLRREGAVAALRWLATDADAIREIGTWAAYYADHAADRIERGEVTPWEDKANG